MLRRESSNQSMKPTALFAVRALAFFARLPICSLLQCSSSQTDAHPNESFSIFHFRGRHRGVYLRMRHFEHPPRRSNRTEHLQDGRSWQAY